MRVRTHTHSLTTLTGVGYGGYTPAPGAAARRSSVFLLPAVQGGSMAVDSNPPLHLGSDGEHSAEHHRPPTPLPAVDGAAGRLLRDNEHGG